MCAGVAIIFTYTHIIVGVGVCIHEHQIPGGIGTRAVASEGGVPHVITHLCYLRGRWTAVNMVAQRSSVPRWLRNRVQEVAVADEVRRGRPEVGALVQHGAQNCHQPMAPAAPNLLEVGRRAGV